MKRFVASVLLLSCLAPAALFAIDGRKAEYVGGTLTTLTEQSEGRFDTTDENALVFIPEKHREVLIPYKKITELEYGQKAGRRIGVAILVSPLALFSKKRNHFLTITYKDAAGKEQAAVFELGKEIVRTTLKIVETRSGKDIQYQDEEARKAIGGGK